MKTLTCTFTENLNRIATGCLNHIKIILTLTLLLLSQQTQAAAPSSGITYTGRILDSNDQPVTASQVYFTITISDPDQKCWLYTEQRLVDMSSSSGNFSFEVGSNDPTTLYGTPSLNNPLGGGPATFADVFDNSKSFTSLAAGSYTCPGGTYNPSTSTDKYEGRVMAIFFRIGAAGTDQALPALRITPVPLAMQAINSVKVNGYDKNHLLRIDTSIASPVNSDINATQLAEFFRLVNNPGTAYISSIPSMGGDVTGTVAANTVAKIQNVAVTAPTTGDTGKVLTYNGTNLVWQSAATSAITSLNGLTTSTQTFATGTSGTDFNISSSGSAHTFNIPTASSSNRGLLSTTDWTTFNSKQSSALGSGQVWIGNASGAAQAQTLSGDATVSASGNVTVDKTQSAAASKILQLDSSGNAYVAGVDIKGTGTGEAQLRFTGSTDMVLNLPTTSGSANQFLQTDGAGNLSWASQSAMLPAITAGQVWVGNASNGAQAFTLSGDIASVSNTGLVTLSTSATGSNKLPLAGGTMSGAIAMGGNNISNAGDISLAAGKFLGLGSGSTAGTVAGQIWYDSGIIKYFDGTTTQSLGVAGAGITSLNGLTSNTQSFVNGTSGNSPAFSSAGSAHTLNIPMASASGSVTAGLISNADYSSMMAKQSNTLAAGQVWVGNASGVAQAFSLSGDISSVSNTGSVIVNKTTTGQANYILALDGSGIANVKGLDVQSGTGKVSFLTNGAFTNYTLTLPNAAPGANQIMKSDASGNLSWVTYLANVSDSAPLTNGKMWIGNASGIASEVTMSGDATITNAGLLSLKNTGTAGTYTKVITDAQGRVTSGSALAASDVTTALGYTPVNKAGDTMSGDLNTQNLNIAAGKFLGLGAGSTAGTTAGQMWYDSGVIKYFDGTTTQSLGVAGAGITSLNGLTSNTQSFVNGTSGNSPAFSSAGSAHTLNIPMASASGSVTAGLISNADYSSMMAKQSSALADSFVWIGNASGAAQARALSGDVTISNVGLVTANKTTTGQANKLLSLDGSSVGTMNGLSLVNTGTVTLQAGTASSTYSLSLPSASPTGNQIMQVSSTGVLSWVSNAANVNNAASLTAGKMWIGNASGIAVEQTMSGDATISNAGLLTLASVGTAGTYSKVVTDAQGRVTSGSALASSDITTALGYTPVNKAGDTMSGNLMMGAGKFIGLGSGSTAGTVAGQIWYDSGVVKYFDGTTTQSLGVAGAGITTLNGLSANTQSFVINTSGTDFAVNSAGSAHTFSLPSASATNRGALTSADWSTFNAKQSNTLASTQVWVGNSSGGAQARTLSGDVTIDNVGLVTLKNTGSVGTYYKVVTDAQGRVVSGTSSISNTDLPSLADTKIWIGNSASTATPYAISGDATMSNVGLLTLKNTGTSGTYFKVVTDAQGRVTSGSALVAADITTALGYTPVNKAGDTMSGALNMGGQNISNAGDVSLAAGKFLGLGAGSTAGTTAGQMWYDSGVIKYFDGTTTKALGVAGSGITSLNGLTSGVQSFVVGSAGNSPAITSASSAHTLDIPMASASGSVTAGLISNADYAAFNAKMSSSLAAGQVWVGNASGAAVARALSGDIASVSNVGLVTVNKTTTGTSSTILSLDGSGVANAYGFGVKGATSGTVAVQAAGTTANYSITLPAAAPAANQIMQSDASGVLSWVSNAANVNNAASLTAGKMWIGNASNIAVEQTMSGDATISNVGLLTLKNTGTAGTYFKVVTDAQGRVTSGSALAASDITTALTYTPVNKAGDTMSGSLMLAAGQYLGLGSGSTAGTVAGQVWYDSGTIKYFDGTTTKSLGVAGAGITTLNGLSGTTQTFATPGTSGTAPAWSFAGSTHTLNIPLAATASVTAGLVSNADYTSMMAKQSNSLTAASVWVGNSSGGAQERALSGDVTISNVGLVTLKNTGSVGTYYKVVTDAQGRVTSGTSTMSNTDMPTLADTKIWIGNSSSTATPYALSGDATMSNIGLVTLKSVGTAGTYWKVVTDAQGRVTSGSALASGDVTTALGFTPAAAGSGYVNGGNSFTGNATIGLNDAYTLGFKTSGTTQMTLTAAGNLGIGTATPISKVQVHSTANSDNAVSVSVSGSGDSQKAKLDLVTLADSSALGASSGNRGWSMTAYGNVFTGSDANDLDFSYWNGSAWIQGLRLAQDGNVGIGSTSPSYSLDFNSRTDGVRLPAGTTAQRPTNAAGVFRYNTSNNTVEFYNGSAWTTLASTANSMANTLTSGTIWIGNGSGVAQERALSGDITMTNVGLVTADKTTTGAANKLLALDGTGVTNVKGLDIQTGTGKVTLQTSGAFTNYVLTLPNSSGATNQVLSNTGGGVLGWASVLSASGINNTASLTSAKIWVGNGSNVAVERSVAGDLTMDNAGSFTLNTVTVAKGGTGQTSLTSGSILVGNGTAGIGTLAGGTTGNVIYATSASAWGSGTPDTAGLIDKTSNQTSGITGNKTFSGYTVIANGSFSSTGIALGATTLSVSTGNGSIGTGSGGTSTGGGGQIYAAAFDNSTGATIDFNKGNVQTTSYDCGGNVTLNNMQSGGSYTLIVTGAGTTKCTLYDGGTLIPDARFAPTNSTRTASSATIYTMIKVGTKVYVSWIPGFSP